MWSNEKTDVALTTAWPLRQRAFRVLLATQGIFFVSLAWCMLLEHGSNAQISGISFYGVNHRTVVLAVVGYVSAAVGLWRLSLIFSEGGLDPLLWTGLRVIAVMLTLLLVTPYNGGAFLNWARMSVGVAGALTQLAIVIMLLRRWITRRDPRLPRPVERRYPRRVLVTGLAFSLAPVRRDDLRVGFWLVFSPVDQGPAK